MQGLRKIWGQEGGGQEGEEEEKEYHHHSNRLKNKKYKFEKGKQTV